MIEINKKPNFLKNNIKIKWMKKLYQSLCVKYTMYYNCKNMQSGSGQVLIMFKTPKLMKQIHWLQTIS